MEREKRKKKKSNFISSGEDRCTRKGEKGLVTTTKAQRRDPKQKQKRPHVELLPKSIKEQHVHPHARLV